MAETYGNYINGEWVPAASGETFADTNPARPSEVIGEFARSNAADIDAAVAAASKAQKQWRRTPAPLRGEIIARATRILVERKDELAAGITEEMGKVLVDSGYDVQGAITSGEYMAGEGRRMFGDTVPSGLPNRLAMTVRDPVGVVGIVTPWNLPMLMPAWKLFPALVCGNAVVVKPAEDTPLTAVRLFQILEEAGVPPGVANLVTGYGPEAGEPLITHPDVDMISFTGSRAVGTHIASTAGAQLKHVSLEMGGKNALVVLDDADLEEAVTGALWGGFSTSGQRCTASSRLVVDNSVADEVVERLAAGAEELIVGDGSDPKTQVGPIINQKQLDRVHSYTEIGLDEGAKLVIGGEQLDLGTGGFFYSPTIFDFATPEMRISQEEIFGPTITVIRVDGDDEAIEVANGTRYGLSAAVYTNDTGRALRAVSELEAGLVYLNAPTIGSEIHLPFGGVKDTGNGHRESGTAAIEQFTETKTVFLDFSGTLQRAHIDEPTD
ncbi:MAG TPA: aldehyde dehydrogenase family protein [Acidimicrobiia bacterium]|nr:aldehyde dehydrogenase family protein [Acidimicrobiia bacterium]